MGIPPTNLYDKRKYCFTQLRVEELGIKRRLTPWEESGTEVVPWNLSGGGEQQFANVCRELWNYTSQSVCAHCAKVCWSVHTCTNLWMSRHRERADQKADTVNLVNFQNKRPRVDSRSQKQTNTTIQLRSSFSLESFWIRKYHHPQTHAVHIRISVPHAHNQSIWLCFALFHTKHCDTKCFTQ